MGWTGAVVLYACSWFVVLWVILPRGVATQAEVGEVVPGTPPGAPADMPIKRKFLWATALAFIPVLTVALIMKYEILVLDDFDFLFPASFLEKSASGS